MRWALLAIVGCYMDPVAPVANLAAPPRRVPPYAVMMTALCGRVEQTWDEAPPELAGYRLAQLPTTDPEHRAWRLIGAPGFRLLREQRATVMVGRAELELEPDSARAICDALADGLEIGSDDAIARGPRARCAWEDPASTHRVEVTVRGAHPRMSCAL